MNQLTAPVNRLPASERLTTKEAAEYLDVSEQTLRNWRSLGIGPISFTLGKRSVRYLRADLDAWITEQYEQSVIEHEARA